MRPQDSTLAQRLAASLVAFDKERCRLLGIHEKAAFETFIEQLLESIHRVKYVSILKARKLSEQSADPDNEIFDPLKAAILHHRSGNIDESFWLVFLLTHFGKHRKAGWQYVRDIYGCLGEGNTWSWTRISHNVTGFRKWLHRHGDSIKSKPVHGGFGNHRKYESLDAYSPNGTGAAIESYVGWVGPLRSHESLLETAYQHSGGNPKVAFDYLFNSMSTVVRFGRTARFDYLTMVGHIGLANIEPGSAYLRNSTGPIHGAKLLFCGKKSTSIETATLEGRLIELDSYLEVGMQVLEDTLCNWQKRPESFRKFRG